MQTYYSLNDPNFSGLKAGVSITVTKQADGAVATIYDPVVQGNTQSNPMTTDANGRFSFAALDGAYTIRATPTGKTINVGISLETPMVGVTIPEYPTRDDRNPGQVYVSSSDDKLHFINPLGVDEALETTSGPLVASSVSYTQTTGTTPVTLQSYLDAEGFRPEAYGAKADGSTDDQAAIQAAATAATAAGGTLVLSAGKTYRITSTVTFQSHVQGTGAIILTDNGFNSVAIQCGNSTTTTTFKTMWLPQVHTSKTGTGWSQTSAVGVYSINMTSSEIHFSRVLNFYKGIYITANNGKGASYNKFFLPKLENNKIGLHVKGGLDATSWSNEAVFIGGSALSYTGETAAGSRQIYLESYPTGYNLNSLHFFGFSFESGAEIEFGLEVYGAQDITFTGGRYESTTNVAIKLGGIDASRPCQDITFTGGYTVYNIQFTFGSFVNRGTAVVSGRGTVRYGGGAGGFDRSASISSDSDPTRTIFYNSDLANMYNATSPTTWLVAEGADYTDYKATGDNLPRLRIAHAGGRVSFGDGGTALGPYLSTYSSNTGIGLTSGNLAVVTAGTGLRVAEGSNAKMGTAVLVTGTKVVTTTAVTANSRIFITSNADGGTPGWLRVSARSAGTSFTITSSSGTDTSTVAWIIFEPS